MTGVRIIFMCDVLTRMLFSPTEEEIIFLIKGILTRFNMVHTASWFGLNLSVGVNVCSVLYLYESWF